MKPTVSGAALGLVAAGVAAALVVSVFSVCLQAPRTARASTALPHASSSERRLRRTRLCEREDRLEACRAGKIAAGVCFMMGLAGTLLVQRFAIFSALRPWLAQRLGGARFCCNLER